MNISTAKIIWISLLVAALVAGTFVGNVYFNVPMEAFPRIFVLLAIISAGLNRIFSKKQQEPRPEPTSEEKLRTSLAAYAGLSGLAIIIGIGVGLHAIDYFEKTGRQPSAFWMFAVLIGVPTAVIIFFIKKRTSIIRNTSN